jgi:hypothetical protein
MTSGTTSTRVHIDDPDERQQWIEGRRDRLELAREAGWGGVSWLSVAAGVFAAIGFFALLVGIASAVLHALGITMSDWTDDEWKRVGLGAGLLTAAGLLVAFTFGGYVAGRMARRAGLRHGVLVFVVAVVVAAAAGGVAWLEDATAAIADHLDGLGAPTGDSTWFGLAVVSGAVALAGMLVGSLLGAARGERWHQRLVARALDPNVGPEADLRSDVEAQREAAEKALERARKAGVVPTDEEPESGTTEPADPHANDREDHAEQAAETEPETTAAGRPTPPSS